LFKRLPTKLLKFQHEVSVDLKKIAEMHENIKIKLRPHSKEKSLKGDELVGSLGEIYGKLLYNGKLVGDTYQHDFEAGDMRVSVKARKGGKKGWVQTSAIAQKDGEGCPTHLLFVHLDDDYRLFEAWLYPWNDILTRIKRKSVRKIDRSFIFRVNPKGDEEYLVYRRPVKDKGNVPKVGG